MYCWSCVPRPALYRSILCLIPKSVYVGAPVHTCVHVQCTHTAHHALGRAWPCRATGNSMLRELRSASTHIVRSAWACRGAGRGAGRRCGIFGNQGTQALLNSVVVSVLAWTCIIAGLHKCACMDTHHRVTPKSLSTRRVRTLKPRKTRVRFRAAP